MTAGKVGITLNINWGEPINQTASAIDAAERSVQWAGGWFANPIFSSAGNYPQVMIDKVNIYLCFNKWKCDGITQRCNQIRAKSLAAGLPQSRLPVFTAQELVDLKGSADFFGLNFYTSEYVGEQIYPSNLVGYDTDKDTYSVQDKENWYG